MSSLPSPLDLLPQRPPFLFVDEITALEPGESGAGKWHLTGKETFFAGHFPDAPVVPGVLLIESLAQLTGCVLHDGRAVTGLLGLVRSARFYRTVTPGETVDMTVRIDTSTEDGAEAVCVAKVGDAVAAKVKLMISVVPSSAVWGS